jgi:hypothetical protein
MTCAQAEMQLASTFAEVLIRRWVPLFTGSLRWERGCLVVSSAQYGTGTVLPPREGVPVTGTHLAERTPSAVGAVGALAALTAAILLHGGRDQEALVLEADLLYGALPNAPVQERLGFMALRNGWVGMAVVGMDQQRLVRSLLACGLRDRSPVTAASTLQSFGIPALPARAVPSVKHRESLFPSRATHADAGLSLPQILRGVRVADLGRLVAAPFAVELLGKLGAAVSRIRPLGSGGWWGAGEEVNLRTEDGQARARALVGAADVLVENCSHRAGARLLDLLADERPRHVVAIRGFGMSSPCADWRVLGFLAEAALAVGAGPMEKTEQRWIPAPTEPLWDRVAGTVAAAAAVSRLAEGSRGDAAPPASETVPLMELAVLLAKSRLELAHAA